MKFYDENMDLYQLIEKANLGDVGAIIKCIGYFISMGDSESDILKELRLKYIDAAGEFAKIDDYAIKAQEALWRLSA